MRPTRVATTHVLLAVFAVMAVFPNVLMWLTAFKDATELATNPYGLPAQWQFGNFVEAWRQGNFGVYVRSSVIVVVPVVVRSGFLSVLAGYAFGAFQFRGRNLLFALFLIGIMVPTEGVIIPLYYVMDDFGLLNTYWALILPLAINPFYLIIVKNFFQELPEELQEAARIDGCTEIGGFFRIVLPLSKPILATFSLFYAVAIWNDFMSPLLYISDTAKWTLQMFVRQVTVSSDMANTLGQLDPSYIPPEQGLKFAVIVAFARRTLRRRWGTCWNEDFPRRPTRGSSCGRGWCLLRRTSRSAQVAGRAPRRRPDHDPSGGRLRRRRHDPDPAGSLGRLEYAARDHHRTGEHDATPPTALDAPARLRHPARLPCFRRLRRR